MLKRPKVDINKMNTTQLKTFISSKGKTLNERLANLEREGYESQSWLYQHLSSQSKYKPYTTKSKSGHFKLDIRTRGKDRNELLKVARIIEKSLFEYHSSTISEIKKSHKKSYQTLKKRYKFDLTFEQFADIATTMGFESAISRFGSDFVMQLNKISNNADVIKKTLENQGNFNTIKDVDAYLEKTFTKDQFIPLGAIYSES